MEVAGFNVNGLRARLPIVSEWLSRHRPGILCVQETKVQDHDFPADAFANTGYEFIFKGQKKYNGVAIFSRLKFKDVKIGFDDEPKDGPRLIKAKIGKVNVVNTYIPQGYMPETDKFRYKLQWFERLRKFFEDNFKSSDLVVWTGDLNAAMEDKDVHDPIGLKGHVCFCDETTKAIHNSTFVSSLHASASELLNSKDSAFWCRKVFCFSPYISATRLLSVQPMFIKTIIANITFIMLTSFEFLYHL